MKPYRSTRDHVGAVHQKGASGHWHLGILNCLRHVPKKAMNGMQLLLEIKALEKSDTPCTKMLHAHGTGKS